MIHVRNYMSRYSSWVFYEPLIFRLFTFHTAKYFRLPIYHIMILWWQRKHLDSTITITGCSKWLKVAEGENRHTTKELMFPVCNYVPSDLSMRHMYKWLDSNVNQCENDTITSDANCLHFQTRKRDKRTVHVLFVSIPSNNSMLMSQSSYIQWTIPWNYTQLPTVRLTTISA